jgi:hypothetical protein
MLLSELVARSERNAARSAALRSRSQAAIAASKHLASFFRLPVIRGGSDAPLLSRRRRTLDKILLGGLPVPIDEKVWVGPGSLKLCNGCDEPIKAEDREFELDVLNALTLRFHAECYAAWFGFIAR